MKLKELFKYSVEILVLNFFLKHAIMRTSIFKVGLFKDIRVSPFI
jgi:hypothetical protein